MNPGHLSNLWGRERSNNWLKCCSGPDSSTSGESHYFSELPLPAQDGLLVSLQLPAEVLQG